MKKRKIIGIGVALLCLVALVVFASCYQASDSHLRVEGVRVRVPEGSLVVSDCDEENATYCKKVLEVNGEEQTLEFEFVNFRENGYPDAVRTSINGHEFYFEDGLKIEENGSVDYPIFLNFQVIDDVIVFTYTDGSQGRTTTLYAIDTEGNIVLEEKEIDDDDMVLKDYTEFIWYDENVIKVYATRVVEDVNYHGESVCNADGDEVLEAYYTYTYEGGKFEKEQTDEVTADEFIENRGIICANRAEE